MVNSFSFEKLLYSIERLCYDTIKDSDLATEATMSTRSSIEWTESTWNPLTGCTKISPGCKHCYAERMARRLQAMGQPNYANSLEPLLGPLPKLDLQSINWVIVGGESGPGARPLQEEWVLDVRDQCQIARVPFFFKQWGGVRKKRAGRLLEGRTWDAMPALVGA